MIYFDNASSKLNPNLFELLNDLSNISFSNPHSLSKISENTTNKIELIREKVLKYVNANPEIYDCIFTSGTTNGLKLIAENFNWNCYNQLIYTLDNHTSVIGMREYALLNGSSVQVVDFSNHELINISSFFDIDSKNRYLYSLNYNKKHKKSMENLCNLFVMPSESNFSGKLYNRNLIFKIRNLYNNTLFVYDVAKYISTNKLDMSDNLIDIAPISFYKIFGFPTGLGCLIFKKKCIKFFDKIYFGGGTIILNSPFNNFHLKKESIHQKFEDGSPNYLNIIYLEKFLDKKIDYNYIKEITYYFYDRICNIYYDNSERCFELYDLDYNLNFEDFKKCHGSIISFNLKREDKTYIGYKEVETICYINNIAIRTGCLCNNGACMKNLNIKVDDLKKNLEKGHSCSNPMDLIDGKPTGVIRVSFCENNIKEEIDIFINIIKEMLKNNNNFNSFNKKQKQIEISKLVIYPIKSCCGVDVDNWEISDTGLLYDREWCFINSNNKIMGQKLYPQLAGVKVKLDFLQGTMKIFINGESISIKLTDVPNESINNKELTQCTCQENSIGAVYNDAINYWFSQQLEVDCKFVRIKNSSRLMKNEQLLSFANQGQFLLITENSIKDINDRGDFTFNYRRYRPNIVIKYDSLLEPYEEDNWRNLNLLNNEESYITLNLKFFDRCTRCGMVNIIQDEENDYNNENNLKENEPLLMMSKYRREREKIYFGILLYQERNFSFTLKNKLFIGNKFIVY